MVVELVTNRSERMAPGSLLEGPTGPLRVVTASPSGGSRWRVAFAGVDDRLAAERLRGASLRAEALVDPDVLWVHELVGAVVVDRAGTVVGRVTDVQANPASDLLVVDHGPLIPLRFVTDHTAGRVTVELPPGLLDV